MMAEMEERVLFVKIVESTPSNWEDVNAGDNVVTRKYKDEPAPPTEKFEGLTIYIDVEPNKKAVYHLKKGYSVTYSRILGDNMVTVRGNPSDWTGKP